MTTEERKSDLENRSKIVELSDKITNARANRIKIADESRTRHLAMRKAELDNKILEKTLNKEDTGFFGDPKVMSLLHAMSAWAIDNDRTVVGSEPALRSVWTSEELDMLKKKLLKHLK